jgi:exosortase/archaeosortase family protein
VTRHRGFLIAARVLLALAGVVAGFWLLVDPIRSLEGQAAAFLAGEVLGAPLTPFGSDLLIAPRTGPVFFGVVTQSCSSAPLLGGLALVAGLALPKRLHRRYSAFLVAALVVLALNVARLGFAAWVGATWGMEKMATFHDLAGTPMTLIGSALGVIVLWRLAVGRLPQAAAT